MRNLASHRPTQSLTKQTMTCSKQAKFERYLLQGQAGNQVFLALRQPELPIIIEKGPLYTFLVVLTLSEHIIRNTPPLCLWSCLWAVSSFSWVNQGYTLRKILGSPSGTQPCRLGYPEVKLSSLNENKNWKLISLETSVKCMHWTKPLNNQRFDFTDEFKHSESSHFAL